MSAFKFFFWPSPAAWKVAIALEEIGLPYGPVPVDLSRGDQYGAEFLAVSPNSRVPALVDYGVDGAPVTVFEAGAILWYLATKVERLVPMDFLGQKECLEWLFWAGANLDPAATELHHFHHRAPDATGHQYALERNAGEFDRCLTVLERRLKARRFLLGQEYSIADIMAWPWIALSGHLGRSLHDFPNVRRWHGGIGARPAVHRGLAVGNDLATGPSGYAMPVPTPSNETA